MKIGKGSLFASSLYFVGLFGMLLSSMMNAIFPFYTQYAFSSFMVVGVALDSTKRCYSKKYIKWLLSFFPFFVISFIWAMAYTNALGIIIMSMVPMLLACVSTMYYLCSGGSIKAILWIYLGAAFIMGAYVLSNVGEILIGARIGSSLNEDYDTPAWNANTIGETLCYALFAGWVLFMGKGKNKLLSLAYLALAVGMLFIIFLSGSRKVVFMLMLPILYFTIFGDNRHKILWSIIAIAVLVGGYFLIMNVEMLYWTIGYRFEDLIEIVTGNSDGTEDTSRFDLAKYGLTWFQDRPIFGHGLNNFRVLSNKTSDFGGRNFYAHNNYVELLVDVGIIGFILFYWGYIYLFNQLVCLKKKYGIKIPLYLGE